MLKYMLNGGYFWPTRGPCVSTCGLHACGMCLATCDRCVTACGISAAACGPGEATMHLII